ncbi:MAG TPA: reverse transcriptase N-terminal domain-containing protein [Oscillatoriaceae cyanobacterium M7585_C2015_266]|nr:reverse transcriptase N-terminal domain-containing protein [Oscillatoriaceae cyanobacterium M7585_C2015_266]
MEIKQDKQWLQIDWKAIEDNVYRLQKRIYLASSRGDIKVVRYLQKNCSWSAKMLAVSSFTQNKQEKICWYGRNINTRAANGTVS